MSTQDRDKWIHECFVENYDILVVRARRRAGNDPILRNEIEDCVIEAFEMAWNKYVGRCRGAVSGAGKLESRNWCQIGAE